MFLMAAHVELPSPRNLSNYLSEGQYDIFMWVAVEV